MPADADTTAGNALAIPAENAFRDLITFRLVRAVTSFMPAAPLWLRNLLFCLALAGIWAGGTWLLGENPIMYRLEVWAMTILLTVVIGFEVFYRNILRILREEVAPQLSPGLAQTVADRFKAGFTPRRQLLLGIVIGVIMVIVGLVALPYAPGTYHFAAPFYVYPITFFYWILMTPFFHFAVLLIIAMLQLARDDTPLYPIDPRHSTLIRALTTMSQEMILFTAVAAALGIIIVAFLVPTEPVILTTSLLITGVVFSTIVVLFVMLQVSLSRLVARRRAHTLAELQAKLASLYERSDTLSDEERKRFDYLLTLHDRVAQTSESAINLGGALRFFSPMLVPLFSLLVTNVNLPFITQDIKDILQQVLARLHS